MIAGSLVGSLLVPRGSEPESPAGLAGEAGAVADRPNPGETATALEPSTVPAAVGTASDASEASTVPRAVGTAPDASPVATTLSAADTQQLAQAVAARLAGDLEGSRRILQELLARDPEHTAAAELLEKVEAELWSRDTLPLEFRAEHNHRLGHCDGRLTLEAEGITYSSRDHGLWRWGFDELQQMRRKARRELELVTGEKDALRLGGGKRYNFKLKGATLDADDWTRFRMLARGG